VINAAALCPAPPLLVAELSGGDPAAATVRAAAARAVSALTASGPDLVAAVGVADETREWPPTGQADLAPYGGPRLPPDGDRVPFGVGLGTLLLDAAGWTGRRALHSVGRAEPAEGCRAVAAAITGAAGRVGLLVLGDGSARRTLKAPGYLDERAGPFDAAIERSIVDGELAGLGGLDPALAAELMVTGWPALQVLAAALGNGRADTTLLYAGAPFGVGYFVATIRP
jgi:hypothetical protein